MSGHSKWSTIKRKKGRADEQRGRLFTKLIREITIAAREGGGEVDGNPRLRAALQTARENNMPSTNIDRAIKKGTGELPGVAYEEVAYEGYGPGGVAFLIETVTDNRNRTTAEIRHLLTKVGGRMGEVGSVAWIFEQKGLIVVDKGGHDEERVMLVAIEAGAEDVSDETDSWEIITQPHEFSQVVQALKEKGINPASADLARLPKTTVELGRDVASRVVKLADSLEDHDDVQRVSANFDIPDEVLRELSSN